MEEDNELLTLEGIANQKELEDLIDSHLMDLNIESEIEKETSAVQSSLTRVDRKFNNAFYMYVLSSAITMIIIGGGGGLFH